MKKLKFNPFIIPLAICLIGMGKYTIDTMQVKNAEKVYEDEFIKDTPEDVKETTPEVIAVVPKEEVTTPEVIEDTLSYELLDNNYEFKQVDFESLNSINEEVVGWLDMNGIINDFPIVQGEDNKEYLHTDMYGNYSNAGTPFMDYRSSTEQTDRLTIIYGHHMKNGSGFANICNYKDKDYIKDHPYGEYYDEDGNVYMIKFFAGIVVDGTNSSILDINNISDEEFNEYITSIKNQSYFDSNIEVEVDDNLLALVTCSYETNNSRLILYGVLEEQYTIDNRVDNQKVLSR